MYFDSKVLDPPSPNKLITTTTTTTIHNIKLQETKSSSDSVVLLDYI